ncbi:hypothetical protein BLNAU_8915 [Blattamonas nauphoetae]|uniref:Uncharacterized protein n=1 Tax=Blattamonas nauphoetae TaxID=2049346 RepID=A0ABQ9XXE1_9EUKA|nr:hypothetical protein BLNAU_8915 [Blattamonas nauphoetae]
MSTEDELDLPEPLNYFEDEASIEVRNQQAQEQAVNNECADLLSGASNGQKFVSNVYKIFNEDESKYPHMIDCLLRPLETISSNTIDTATLSSIISSEDTSYILNVIEGVIFADNPSTGRNNNQLKDSGSSQQGPSSTANRPSSAAKRPASRNKKDKTAPTDLPQTSTPSQVKKPTNPVRIGSVTLQSLLRCSFFFRQWSLFDQILNTLDSFVVFRYPRSLSADVRSSSNISLAKSINDSRSESPTHSMSMSSVGVGGLQKTQASMASIGPIRISESTNLGTAAANEALLQTKIFAPLSPLDLPNQILLAEARLLASASVALQDSPPPSFPFNPRQPYPTFPDGSDPNPPDQPLLPLPPIASRIIRRRPHNTESVRLVSASANILTHNLISYAALTRETAQFVPFTPHGNQPSYTSFLPQNPLIFLSAVRDSWTFIQRLTKAEAFPPALILRFLSFLLSAISIALSPPVDQTENLPKTSATQLPKKLRQPPFLDAALLDSVVHIEAAIQFASTTRKLIDHMAISESQKGRPSKHRGEMNADAAETHQFLHTPQPSPSTAQGMTQTRFDAAQKLEEIEEELSADDLSGEQTEDLSELETLKTLTRARQGKKQKLISFGRGGLSNKQHLELLYKYLSRLSQIIKRPPPFVDPHKPVPPATQLQLVPIPQTLAGVLLSLSSRFLLDASETMQNHFTSFSNHHSFLDSVTTDKEFLDFIIKNGIPIPKAETLQDSDTPLTADQEQSRSSALQPIPGSSAIIHPKLVHSLVQTYSSYHKHHPSSLPVNINFETDAVWSVEGNMRALFAECRSLFMWVEMKKGEEASVQSYNTQFYKDRDFAEKKTELSTMKGIVYPSEAAKTMAATTQKQQTLPQASGGGQIPTILTAVLHPSSNSLPTDPIMSARYFPPVLSHNTESTLSNLINNNLYEQAILIQERVKYRCDSLLMLIAEEADEEEPAPNDPPIPEDIEIKSKAHAEMTTMMKTRQKEMDNTQMKTQPIIKQAKQTGRVIPSRVYDGLGIKPGDPGIKPGKFPKVSVRVQERTRTMSELSREIVQLTEKGINMVANVCLNEAALCVWMDQARKEYGFQIRRRDKAHSGAEKLALFDTPPVSPLLISRTHNSITLLPVDPAQKEFGEDEIPASDDYQFDLMIFGKKSDSASVLSLQSTTLEGTGVPVPINQPITITGLDPNSSYVFGCARCDKQGNIIVGVTKALAIQDTAIGKPTAPIVTCFPIPAISLLTSFAHFFTKYSDLIKVAEKTRIKRRVQAGLSIERAYFEGTSESGQTIRVWNCLKICGVKCARIVFDFGVVVCPETQPNAIGIAHPHSLFSELTSASSVRNSLNKELCSLLPHTSITGIQECTMIIAREFVRRALKTENISLDTKDGGMGMDAQSLYEKRKKRIVGLRARRLRRETKQMQTMNYRSETKFGEFTDGPMRSEEPNFTSLIEKMDEDDMWKKVEDSEDSSDDDSTGDDSDSEEENDHTIVHLLPTTPQLLNSLSPFELLLRAIACFTVSIEAAVMIKDYPTIVAVSSELYSTLAQSNSLSDSAKTHPAIVRSLILILEALKTIPVPNEERPETLDSLSVWMSSQFYVSHCLYDLVHLHANTRIAKDYAAKQIPSKRNQIHSFAASLNENVKKITEEQTKKIKQTVGRRRRRQEQKIDAESDIETKSVDSVISQPAAKKGKKGKKAAASEEEPKKTPKGKKTATQPEAAQPPPQPSDDEEDEEIDETEPFCLLATPDDLLNLLESCVLYDSLYLHCLQNEMVELNQSGDEQDGQDSIISTDVVLLSLLPRSFSNLHLLKGNRAMSREFAVVSNSYCGIPIPRTHIRKLVQRNEEEEQQLIQVVQTTTTPFSSSEVTPELANVYAQIHSNPMKAWESLMSIASSVQAPKITTGQPPLQLSTIVSGCGGKASSSNEPAEVEVNEKAPKKGAKGKKAAQPTAEETGMETSDSTTSPFTALKNTLAFHPECVWGESLLRTAVLICDSLLKTPTPQQSHDKTAGLIRSLISSSNNMITSPTTEGIAPLRSIYYTRPSRIHIPKGSIQDILEVFNMEYQTSFDWNADIEGQVNQELGITPQPDPLEETQAEETGAKKRATSSSKKKKGAASTAKKGKKAKEEEEEPPEEEEEQKPVDEIAQEAARRKAERKENERQDMIFERTEENNRVCAAATIFAFWKIFKIRRQETAKWRHSLRTVQPYHAHLELLLGLTEYLRGKEMDLAETLPSTLPPEQVQTEEGEPDQTVPSDLNQTRTFPSPASELQVSPQLAEQLSLLHSKQTPQTSQLVALLNPFLISHTNTSDQFSAHSLISGMPFTLSPTTLAAISKFDTSFLVVSSPSLLSFMCSIFARAPTPLIPNNSQYLLRAAKNGCLDEMYRNPANYFGIFGSICPALSDTTSSSSEDTDKTPKKGKKGKDSEKDKEGGSGGLSANDTPENIPTLTTLANEVGSDRLLVGFDPTYTPKGSTGQVSKPEKGAKGKKGKADEPEKKARSTSASKKVKKDVVETQPEEPEDDLPQSLLPTAAECLANQRGLTPMRRAIAEAMLSFASHVSRAATIAARTSHFSLVMEAWSMLARFWDDVEKGICGEGGGAEIWAAIKQQQWFEEELAKMGKVSPQSISLPALFVSTDANGSDQVRSMTNELLMFRFFLLRALASTLSRSIPTILVTLLACQPLSQLLNFHRKFREKEKKEAYFHKMESTRRRAAERTEMENDPSTRSRFGATLSMALGQQAMEATQVVKTPTLLANEPFELPIRAPLPSSFEVLVYHLIDNTTNGSFFSGSILRQRHRSVYGTAYNLDALVFRRAMSVPARIISAHVFASTLVRIITRFSFAGGTFHENLSMPLILFASAFSQAATQKNASGALSASLLTKHVNWLNDISRLEEQGVLVPGMSIAGVLLKGVDNIIAEENRERAEAEKKAELERKERELKAKEEREAGWRRGDLMGEQASQSEDTMSLPDASFLVPKSSVYRVTIPPLRLFEDDKLTCSWWSGNVSVSTFSSLSHFISVNPSIIPVPISLSSRGLPSASALLPDTLLSFNYPALPPIPPEFVHPAEGAEEAAPPEKGAKRPKSRGTETETKKKGKKAKGKKAEAEKEEEEASETDTASLASADVDVEDVAIIQKNEREAKKRNTLLFIENLLTAQETAVICPNGALFSVDPQLNEKLTMVLPTFSQALSKCTRTKAEIELGLCREDAMSFNMSLIKQEISLKAASRRALNDTYISALQLEGKQKATPSIESTTETSEPPTLPPSKPPSSEGKRPAAKRSTTPSRSTKARAQTPNTTTDTDAEEKQNALMLDVARVISTFFSRIVLPTNTDSAGSFKQVNFTEPFDSAISASISWQSRFALIRPVSLLSRYSSCISTLRARHATFLVAQALNEAATIRMATVRLVRTMQDSSSIPLVGNQSEEDKLALLLKTARERKKAPISLGSTGDHKFPDLESWEEAELFQLLAEYDNEDQYADAQMKTSRNELSDALDTLFICPQFITYGGWRTMFGFWAGLGNNRNNSDPNAAAGVRKGQSLFEAPTDDNTLPTPIDLLPSTFDDADALMTSKTKPSKIPPIPNCLLALSILHKLMTTSYSNNSDQCTELSLAASGITAALLSHSPELPPSFQPAELRTARIHSFIPPLYLSSASAKPSSVLSILKTNNETTIQTHNPFENPFAADSNLHEHLESFAVHLIKSGHSLQAFPILALLRHIAADVVFSPIALFNSFLLTAMANLECGYTTEAYQFIVALFQFSSSSSVPQWMETQQSILNRVMDHSELFTPLPDPYKETKHEDDAPSRPASAASTSEKKKAGKTDKKEAPAKSPKKGGKGKEAKETSDESKEKEPKQQWPLFDCSQSCQSAGNVQALLFLLQQTINSTDSSLMTLIPPQMKIRLLQLRVQFLLILYTHSLQQHQSKTSFDPTQMKQGDAAPLASGIASRSPLSLLSFSATPSLMEGLSQAFPVNAAALTAGLHNTLLGYNHLELDPNTIPQGALWNPLLVASQLAKKKQVQKEQEPQPIGVEGDEASSVHDQPQQTDEPTYLFDHIPPLETDVGASAATEQSKAPETLDKTKKKPATPKTPKKGKGKEAEETTQKQVVAKTPSNDPYDGTQPSFFESHFGFGTDDKSDREEPHFIEEHSTSFPPTSKTALAKLGFSSKISSSTYNSIRAIVQNGNGSELFATPSVDFALLLSSDVLSQSMSATQDMVGSFSGEDSSSFNTFIFAVISGFVEELSLLTLPSANIDPYTLMFIPESDEATLVSILSSFVTPTDVISLANNTLMQLAWISTIDGSLEDTSRIASTGLGMLQHHRLAMLHSTANKFARQLSKSRERALREKGKDRIDDMELKIVLSELSTHFPSLKNVVVSDAKPTLTSLIRSLFIATNQDDMLPNQSWHASDTYTLFRYDDTDSLHFRSLQLQTEIQSLQYEKAMKTSSTLLDEARTANSTRWKISTLLSQSQIQKALAPSITKFTLANKEVMHGIISFTNAIKPLSLAIRSMRSQTSPELSQADKAGVLLVVADFLFLGIPEAVSVTETVLRTIPESVMTGLDDAIHDLLGAVFSPKLAFAPKTGVDSDERVSSLIAAKKALPVSPFVDHTPSFFLLTNRISAVAYNLLAGSLKQLGLVIPPLSPSMATLGALPQSVETIPQTRLQQIPSLVHGDLNRTIMKTLRTLTFYQSSLHPDIPQDQHNPLFLQYPVTPSIAPILLPYTNLYTPLSTSLSRASYLKTATTPFDSLQLRRQKTESSTKSVVMIGETAPALVSVIQLSMSLQLSYAPSPLICAQGWLECGQLLVQTLFPLTSTIFPEWGGVSSLLQTPNHAPVSAVLKSPLSDNPLNIFAPPSPITAKTSTHPPSLTRIVMLWASALLGRSMWMALSASGGFERLSMISDILSNLILLLGMVLPQVALDDQSESPQNYVLTDSNRVHLLRLVNALLVMQHRTALAQGALGSLPSLTDQGTVPLSSLPTQIRADLLSMQKKHYSLLPSADGAPAAAEPTKEEGEAKGKKRSQSAEKKARGGEKKTEKTADVGSTQTDGANAAVDIPISHIVNVYVKLLQESAGASAFSAQNLQPHAAPFIASPSVGMTSADIASADSQFGVELTQLYNTLLQSSPTFAKKCVLAVEELEWMTSKAVPNFTKRPLSRPTTAISQVDEKEVTKKGAKPKSRGGKRPAEDDKKAKGKAGAKGKEQPAEQAAQNSGEGNASQLDRFIFNPPIFTTVLASHTSTIIPNRITTSGQNKLTVVPPIETTLPQELKNLLSSSLHRKTQLDEPASVSNYGLAFHNLVYSVVDGSRTLHVGLRTIPAVYLVQLCAVIQDTLSLHHLWEVKNHEGWIIPPNGGLPAGAEADFPKTKEESPYQPRFAICMWAFHLLLRLATVEGSFEEDAGAPPSTTPKEPGAVTKFLMEGQTRTAEETEMEQTLQPEDNQYPSLVLTALPPSSRQPAYNSIERFLSAHAKMVLERNQTKKAGVAQEDIEEIRREDERLYISACPPTMTAPPVLPPRPPISAPIKAVISHYSSSIPQQNPIPESIFEETPTFALHPNLKLQVIGQPLCSLLKSANHTLSLNRIFSSSPYFLSPSILKEHTSIKPSLPSSPVVHSENEGSGTSLFEANRAFAQFILQSVGETLWEE